ncbi:MAG: S10 family serine carboxypeptidase-like protein, partial [bacterium]
FGFVSYTLDRAAGGAPRPVTFVWNGGPGANSTTVHFVGFGPRRLRSADDPSHPQPVAAGLYDNDATWLEFTDLVFVDPVGTGFARPSKPEYAGEFFNTLGDLASTAEFLRLYLTRLDLLMSPVFLAGESYGTWRASGAAEWLAKKGIDVAGVLLISGGIQMGKVSPDAVRTALFVPSRTATAFFHKKLVPELQRDEQGTLAEVRKWALTEYAPAWERRDSLSEPERDRIIGQLARYTGVDPSTIDRKALAMTSPQFTGALLRDRSLTLGRYDMRVTQAAGGRGGGGGDAGEGQSRNAIIIDYLRGDLQFKTDLTYQGLETGYSSAATGRGGGPGSQWNWNQGVTAMTTGEASATRAGAASVGSGDGPPGGSQPWLRRAMALNPGLKVFIAAGLYDSLNGCDEAPLFIAGESYGVTRASLVADALERRRTKLSGVILLSGGFPLS